MPGDQWALHAIYHSVMGHGDFARYILGSDYGKLHWSNRELRRPRQPSRKEKHDAFLSSLTEQQRFAWDIYYSTRINADICQRLKGLTEDASPERQYSEEEIAATVDLAEKKFTRTLGNRKQTIFLNLVKPYLDTPHHEQDELALEVSFAQRWIFKRVLELGWTVEKFGNFDRVIETYGNTGRSSDKSERMGKKYQWIAYHELLAHLADNLEFREDTWDDVPGEYSGPWQLWLRDIDPSCLLTKTFRIRTIRDEKPWWAPVTFDQWRDESADVAWRKRIDLLPDLSLIPIVKEPRTGKEWLVLETFYNWEEPTPPEVERYNVPRRTIWYALRSYLVRKEDENRFYTWATHQQLSGRSMPESHEQSRVLLGEFFWGPAFQYFNTPYHCHAGWTDDGGRLPCSVLVTTDQYFQERPGYDCSIEETISFYLPAKFIADEMHLQWHGVEGRHHAPSGELAAMDPSVREKGPRALLMDKELLVSFLDANGYRLVWTLVGEKDEIGGRRCDNEWPGRLEISAAMVIESGQVTGMSTAYFVKAQNDKEKVSQYQF